MKFIIDTRRNAEEIIANQINKKLNKNEHVLWLVCGGSNIQSESVIMKKIREKSEEYLPHLTILPMDERYGAPGHVDSNFKQMKDAHFEPGNAQWQDVLARNLSLNETVNFYQNLIEKAFANNTYSIGVFGLGADGHTAGVLPKTIAALQTKPNVVGYQSPPYIRMTLSPQFLARVDTAFVLVYGDDKKEALERLKKNTDTVDVLPSKLLYQIPEAYVYNNLIEQEE